MTQDQRFLAIGCYINSALYLAGCFIAGIVYGHPYAWKLAVVTYGICFLGYLSQVSEFRAYVSFFLVVTSILTGIASGLTLLW